MESEEEKRPEWRGLVQLIDGRPLFSPLSNAVKVKYTSIAASTRHVTLGANSGGVYCFAAEDFRYLCLLANKEGSVSSLSFSPNEGTLAVVAADNNVCFWELNLDDPSNESKRFHVSSILRGGTVTDMTWDRRGTRLFYGDNQGRIAIAYIPKYARMFGASSFFKKVDEIIHIEKSPIVQLDTWQDLLLISTSQRCLLLKLQGETVESLIQVGTKSRVGPFGAFFHPRWTGRPPVVYSARPKGRLWEADIAGTVLSTIKQRDLVTAPPTVIIDIASSDLPLTPPMPSLPSFNFDRLILLLNTYLVTWREGSIFIFHPSSYSLSNWSNQFQGIVDVICVNEKVYILHNNCQSVTCLSYLKIFDILKALMKADNSQLAKQVLCHYSDMIKEEMTTQDRQEMVAAVLQFIADSNISLEPELKELIALMPKKENATWIPTEDDAILTPSEDVTLMDGLEETDGLKTTKEKEREEHQLEKAEKTESELFPVIEETSQFTLEGSEDSTHHLLSEHSGFDHIPDEKNSPSLSNTSTTPTNNGPIGHSLPPAINHTHKVDSPVDQITQYSAPTQLLLLSSPPTTLNSMSPTGPPITTRMGGTGGVATVEEEEGILVVRQLSREKKKKGRSKKRRGSLDTQLSKPFSPSQPSLDDILEGDYPLPVEISPSQSQMSSAATSTDNSPHASLPPSPPKVEIIESYSSVIASTKLDNEGEVTYVPQRSQSLDFTDNFSRSRGQSIDNSLQKPTNLISKVKSMASSQQEGFQRTGRIMKEFLSSLSPTPTAGVHSPSPEMKLDGKSPSPEVGNNPLQEDELTESYHPSISPLSPTAILSPSPSILLDSDTERFVTAVYNTKQSLDDPQVLSSPQYLTETIKEWKEELMLYHTHLQSLFDKQESDVFSHASYTSLDDSIKESVSELVTLCLELKLFGDDETVPGFIEQFRYILHCFRTKQFLVEQSFTSQCEGWRILACSNATSISSTDSAQEIQELMVSSPELSMSLMLRAYESKVTFLHLCANNYPIIEPWEVAALCHLDHKGEIPSDYIYDQETYANYLDLLFAKELQTNVISSLTNNELLLISVTAALSALPDEMIKDQEGQPLPHSHLALWPHQISLTSLTSLCSQLSTRETCERILMLFKQEGYWRGYLDLCVSIEKTDDILKMAAHLQSVPLLQELTTNSDVFSLSSSWQCLLTLLTKLDLPVQPVSNSESLNWVGVVREMVSSIGVEEGGKILNTLSMTWKFPSSLHELLVNLSIVHREQRTIAHGLLEKLDRYLWAPRPVSLGPHLLSVYQKEEEDYEEKERTQDIKSPPPQQEYYPKISQSYIEDAGSHWGIRSNSNRCDMCRYPITAKVSDKEQGAIAFHCGHLFHRQCVPEQACVICFVKKYRTHLLHKSIINKQ